MSHFWWKKNEPRIDKKTGEEIPTGGEMVQVEFPEGQVPAAVALAQPATPAVKERAAPVKKHFCVACDPAVAFGTIGVMSMHFKKVHNDLWEDRDSFRDYLETRG